jgi:predicted RNA-binding protein YlqC (UPF0109 family)
MNRVETIATALKSVVQIMVRLPNYVRVTTETSQDTVGHKVTSFEIDVHQSDRGRLIGRHGANMQALRVLANSAAYVWRARYRVNCSETLAEKCDAEGSRTRPEGKVQLAGNQDIQTTRRN